MTSPGCRWLNLRMDKITIGSREYTVEAIELSADLVAKGRKVYGLTGKNGAQYAAVQYINQGLCFHVVGAQFQTVSGDLRGAVLTDVRGKLEVLRLAGCPDNAELAAAIKEAR